jgi:conjugal transfer pilus assembly protein TraV
MITPGSTIRGIRLPAALFAPMAVAMLTGCTAVGSLMSPYSEKFSCKNPDHGQCIHPDKAYADAVAGVPSHSDPAITHDKAMLKGCEIMRAGKAMPLPRRAARKGSRPISPTVTASIASFRA